MRNGNCIAQNWIKSFGIVLTVPMRNGNSLSFSVFLTSQSCSYRTYEEWKLSNSLNAKLDTVRSYRTYEEWKPQSELSVLRYQLQFLPYLWGMETTLRTQRTHDGIQFLPYLWGMETQMRIMFWLATAGSYRTYEEWKLSSACSSRRCCSNCSYRTYEEWKRFRGLFFELGGE